MTPTYKPFDRVRIKPLEEVKGKLHDNNIWWSEEMDKYAGTVQVIKSFIDSRPFTHYLMENTDWWFTPSMIEGLAEEVKPIRVMVNAVHLYHNWYFNGQEFDVVEHNNLYYKLIDGTDRWIHKLNCPIIPPKADDLTDKLIENMKDSFAANVEKVYGKEDDRYKFMPPKDEGKDVPPGIVSFEAGYDVPLIFYPECFPKGYEDWVRYCIDQKYPIHTIRDSKGVEWSVGEEVQYLNSKIYIISELKWIAGRWWAQEKTMLYPVKDLSKLPPQQQPEPVDRGPDYIMYETVTSNFRQAMIKELAANFDKGDRELPGGWLGMTNKTALSEIYYHTGKLQAALKAGDLDLIKELAADIANGAMMVYDKYCQLLHSATDKNHQP